MVFLLSLSFCLSLLFLQGSLLYSSLLYSIRIPSLNVLKQMQLACTKYPAARASQELRRSFIVPGDGVSMFPFAWAYCTFSPRLKKLSESYQHVSTKSRVLYKMVKMVPGCAKGQKKFILSRSGKLCRLLKLLSLASQHPKQLMKPKSKPQWHATCLKRSRNNTKCYRHARPLQRAMHQAGELARGGRQLQREVMWQGPDALRKLWVYMSLHQWLHCGQRWKLVHNPDANRSGSIWPGTSRLIAGSFTHKQKCLDTQKRTTYVFQAA